MSLLPFKKISIEANLSLEKVKETLQNSISEPDWNVTLDKAINNRILEGEIFESSFLIVMGKYSLTYGRASLLPIMKGIFYYDKKKSKTIIDISIRPFKAGIVILCFFYFLLVVGILSNVKHLHPQFIIIACIFCGVTYYSLIAKFNNEAKFYEDFIRHKFGE